MKVTLELPNDTIGLSVTVLMQESLLKLSWGVGTLNTQDIINGYKDLTIIKNKEQENERKRF